LDLKEYCTVKLDNYRICSDLNKSEILGQCLKNSETKKYLPDCDDYSSISREFLLGVKKFK
jgi:hypothetical protein